MAMVWNGPVRKGNGSLLVVRTAALAARSANSLQPPPAGIRPTPASTRPMYDSSAATLRAQCITSSQPPPSAMPLTAATTGTWAYLTACDIAWKRATAFSRPAKSPAARAGARAWRLAPTENGAFGCQITRPR